jgi:eukaryotic-like serine/threonine-protein kinase
VVPVPASPSDSAAPSALGKYALLASLGRGGMADVFLAVARGPVGFNKLVVVKRLRGGEDAGRLQMFLDEARLSARLSHPNIVNTYEVGEAKGQYFIAMEYLEGQPLDSVLKSRSSSSPPAAPLDEPTAAFIAMQSLEALHYAHELTNYDGAPLEIVHRDVSPHNLFITYQGQVKLLDFGIAKASLNVTHTETGVLKGKVNYMAPEQFGGLNIDRRADVFALGIVLWEMLAGRPLFRGDVTSILMRVTSEDAPLLRTVRAEVSAEIEAIVAKALRRDPGERYATADAMRADLEHLLRGKQGEAEADLARALDETFAQTRDVVRARIKEFLADGSAKFEAASEPNLAQAAELLPSLFGNAESGGGASGSGSGARARSTADAAHAPRRSWRWVAVAAGMLLATGALMLYGKRSPALASTARTEAPAAAGPTTSDVHTETTEVHIETSPIGALIEWGGRPLARTPAEIDLPVGTQTLKISRDGYEPEIVTIDVQAHMPTARAIALRPKVEVAPALTPPPDTERRARVAPAPRTTTSTAAPTTAAPAPAESASRKKFRVVGEEDTP